MIGSSRRRHRVKGRHDVDALGPSALSGSAGSLNQHLEVLDERGQTVLTMPVGHAEVTETQN